MPRERTFHKCRKCDDPAKEYYNRDGIFKGYFPTCGKHPRPKGPELHNWNGGWHRERLGYISVLDPRRAHKNGRSRYILEHRLVMEQVLGRELTRDEVVHHINGVRGDNRPENLVVLPSRQEHETWTKYKILQARIRELEAKLVGCKCHT